MTQELYQHLFKLYQVLTDASKQSYQKGMNCFDKRNENLKSLLKEDEIIQILKNIPENDLVHENRTDFLFQKSDSDLIGLEDFISCLNMSFPSKLYCYFGYCFKKDLVEYFNRLKSLRIEEKVRYNPNPGVYMIELDYYNSIKYKFEDIENYNYFYDFFSHDNFMAICVNALGDIVIDEKLISNLINAAKTLDFDSWIFE